MCDPVSAATTVIGTGMQIAGGVMRAQQEAGYRNEVSRAEREAYGVSRTAREREIARQQGFEQRANDFWTETAQRLGAPQFNQRAQAAQTAFLSNVDAAAPQVRLALPGLSEATPEVQQLVNRQTAQAAAAARKRIEALAKLNAQDRAAEAGTDALTRSADQLATINGMRRGSLGVAHQEAGISPAQVFPADGLLPDLLSGGGALVTRAGVPGGVFGDKSLFGA